MPDTRTHQRLVALDQAQFNGKSLSEDDEAFLYDTLIKPGTKDAYRIHAGLLLTGEDGPILDRLLEKLPQLPQKAQYILVPFLCAYDTYPPYKALLSLLKTTLSKRTADWIIVSLSKSTYPLALPVIAAVSDTDILFRRRIKRLLAKLGLKKIGPFLALMPDVPHANVYKDVFGEEAFNRLREKTS